MRGHVRRLGTDRYLVRISAGQDPVTGKRSQPSRVVHGTRQDAELSLAQLVVENPDRNSLRPRTSLDALVERHVQAPSGSGKKRSPASAYRERSRYVTHVSSSMGDRVADKIKPQELTFLYDALIQKGLAPGSVHAIHRLLRGTSQQEFPPDPGRRRSRWLWRSLAISTGCTISGLCFPYP